MTSLAHGLCYLPCAATLRLGSVAASNETNITDYGAAFQVCGVSGSSALRISGGNTRDGTVQN